MEVYHLLLIYRLLALWTLIILETVTCGVHDSVNELILYIPAMNTSILEMSGVLLMLMAHGKVPYGM